MLHTHTGNRLHIFRRKDHRHGGHDSDVLLRILRAAGRGETVVRVRGQAASSQLQVAANDDRSDRFVGDIVDIFPRVLARRRHVVLVFS